LQEKPRWGFIEIILVYLGIMGVGIIVASVSPMIPLLDSGFGLGDIGFFLSAFLIQFLTTFALVYVLAIFLAHATWSDLGFRSTQPSNFVTYGLGGGIILIVLVILLGMLINHFQPQLPLQDYEKMLRTAGKGPLFIPIFIAGAVLAPLSEELFYRGMIYPVCREHLGPLGGAILAGLIFGLAHWDLWRAIPLSIGGAILCYIYEKTDSIWVSTLAHGVWNGVMSIVIYLSLSYNFL